MSFAGLDPLDRRILIGLWAGGSAAFAGTFVYSVFFTTPYRTAWAWISFIGMAVVEDVVRQRDPSDWRWQMPAVTLVAATIMFRKHPDVTMLVVVAAAPLASLVMRQAWFTLLSKAASWVIVVAVGSATLGLVGFGDMPHFVAATAALVAVYAILERALRWLVFDPRIGDRWMEMAQRVLLSIIFGVAGAGLALGWRTPATGPSMLRLGELCVLITAGMLIGRALGGTAHGPATGTGSVRRLPAALVVGGGSLAVSTLLPNMLSAALAAAGLLVVGIWVFRHRAYPAACLVLGGLLNEIVRAANSGRMPVDTASLPPDLGREFADLTHDSSTYLLAAPGTPLRWLADRFPVPIFPGVASAGDILVALGIVLLAAAFTLAGRRRSPSTSLPQPKAA